MKKYKNIDGPLVIERKKLDPKITGIQQRIAIISTDDGLKIAEVFDTAIPAINEANVLAIANFSEMLDCLVRVSLTIDFMDSLMPDSAPIKDLKNLQKDYIEPVIRKATGGAE